PSFKSSNVVLKSPASEDFPFAESQVSRPLNCTKGNGACLCTSAQPEAECARARSRFSDNPDKCVVLHSTDRGGSALLHMTGFEFRDRVRREINHEHYCGRVDTKG